MKSYWVMWTYIANYSKPIRVQAKDAEAAIDQVRGFYSKDFQQKALVYAFDSEPVMRKGPEA